MVITQQQRIEKAIELIKKHITSDETEQNRDLHLAVGLVVTSARISGILEA